MAELNKTNLIVNYLPQSLTDEEFHALFAKVGTLTASKIIRDRNTGYSYGYGFVDYASEDDAQKAIDALNGLQLQHKRIKVAHSRQGENIKGANLYIRNLPKAAREDEVRRVFCEYGDIVQVRVLTEPASGMSKGVGFVLYSTHEQAEHAIKMLDGKTPPGYAQSLNVKFAEDNKSQARINPSVDANAAFGMAGIAGGFDGCSGNTEEFVRFNGGGPLKSQFRNLFNPLTAGIPSSSGVLPVEKPGYVLFVYNIGPDADEYAIWQLFSPFGQVQKVNVIKDFQKKQGKGYGFVMMLNYEDAVNAIQNLNGFSFYESKPLQVSFKT